MQQHTGVLDYTLQSFEFSNISESVYDSLTLTTMAPDDFMLPPIYCVGIESIDYNKQKICLIEPIIAVVGYNNNNYSMENKELDIITMAKDYDKCYQDFKDEISFVLKEYGEEEDANLTKDAQELKRKMLRYIKK